MCQENTSFERVPSARSATCSQLLQTLQQDRLVGDQPAFGGRVTLRGDRTPGRLLAHPFLAYPEPTRETGSAPATIYLLAAVLASGERGLSVLCADLLHQGPREVREPRRAETLLGEAPGDLCVLVTFDGEF